MGASLGDLLATLRLDAGGFAGPLKAAGGALSGFKSLVGSLAGPLALLGVSFGAFKSAEGAAESLKSVFAAGKELQTMSRSTGQSVGDLVKLRKVFNEVGIGAEAVPGSLQMMQKALGGVNEEGQPTAHVFAQLGLSIQGLKGKTAVEQLQAIGAALGTLNGQEAKVAAARAVFGRQGAEMLALFGDPEAMGQLGAAASAQAQVFQRSAGVFAKISNDLGALAGKTRGFFVGLADGLAPVLLPLLEKLKTIDLTALGQQVGTVIRQISGAIASGRFGELLGDGFREAGMVLANAVSGALTGGLLALGKWYSLLGEMMKAMFSNLPSLLGMLSDGLVGAFLVAGGTFMDVMTKPLAIVQAGLQVAIEGLMEGLGKIPKLGALLGLDGFKATSFVDARAQHEADNPGRGADLIARGQASLAAAGQEGKDVFGGIDFKGRLSGMLDDLKAGFAQGKVFSEADIAAQGKRLADLLAQVNSAIPATAEAAGKSGANPGLLTGAGGGKAIEGDRLARIGGFIGGGAGPALDYARRTAGGVERMVGKLDALAGKLGNATVPTAVWAS